ncbi:PEP-CTERM sorting domain-containing protein [Paraglaciecola polaris]|uniref:PEP motif-containing protein n=1 Tax=Paraglaciecola polaris LMG 21857 TaxID=1129793 RepID=K7ADJ5_9ALTE|nr:PEP-CTERM sorting domain-containing protein [Paraglaciecola polaris]GAC33380.1 PEP motif-containing protein [Paraglaciecola polaris LMG 21857]
MKLISFKKIFSVLCLTAASLHGNAAVIRDVDNLGDIYFTESFEASAEQSNSEALPDLPDTGGTGGELVLSTIIGGGGGVDIDPRLAGKGVGTYTVTNNLADSVLVGFGVTNIDTIAWIDDELDTWVGNQYISYFALTIDASNWQTENLYGFEDEANTAQDLYGDIDDFFKDGENTLNWYSYYDGALAYGQSWSGFKFYGDGPRSSLYAVLEVNNSPNVFVSDVTPLNANTPVNNVPAPGALALLALGIFGMVIRRRK